MKQFQAIIAKYKENGGSSPYIVLHDTMFDVTRVINYKYDLHGTLESASYWLLKRGYDVVGYHVNIDKSCTIIVSNVKNINEA